MPWKAMEDPDSFKLDLKRTEEIQTKGDFQTTPPTHTHATFLLQEAD